MRKTDAKRAAQERKVAQVAERRQVVLRVYQECDEVIAYVIGKLREVGKTPSCQRGCVHCCYLEITASRAEAETIVAWLREHRSPEELARLTARLAAWLDWYRAELPRQVAAGTPRGAGFLQHSPGCVMLEDGECSIYPVRPIACRNHFVSSPPAACGPGAGPGSMVTALDGIAKATSPVAAAIRHVVENQGATFDATVHLVPEWLAHLLDVEHDPWRR